MANRPLEDLFAQLEHERDEADRAYTAAFNALARAVAGAPDLTSALAPGLTTHSTAPRFAGLRRFLRWIIGAAPNDAAMALLEVVRQQQQARARLDSALIQYLQTIAPYVETKDRMTGSAELRDQVTLAQQRLVTLKRDVERLSAGGGREETALRFPARDPSPAPDSALQDVDYLGFEDKFRGSESLISRRLQDYVPLFASSSNVLDVGCGRGELLELFRQNGISARGVDMNAAMVARCREQGLDVEQSDAISYLERQPDASIGGLTAIQVVEHLQPDDLLRFLRLAYDKLRPGAPIVLETINAACWVAFFECYIRDLTHARPLHPGTLEYYVRACGFSGVAVQYREPVQEQDRLDRIPVGDLGTPQDPTLARVISVVNAHADKLNERMLSHMDYAIVARR